MWSNLRDAFGPELKAMYQRLRSDGKLSYPIVEKMFEDHQSKWPEAIFNEDAWFKYLQPLVENGDASYLSMLQGSKAEQRKWWLYNRFRYLDSKYNAGDAQTDVITLRGYAKDDITVTPYADIYAAIKYGSYLVQTRAARNQSYLIACPLDEVNDTEIYIYSSSQLASVGDLSGLKVGYANFSNAVKLQDLKIGDSDSEYTNGNLTELYLGNNTLLRSIDVRNCPNLTMPVDISGCTNIENVYFDGTSITGLSLPNGGILKKLHVPDTMTNLTIRNQPALTEFVIPTGANLTTLRLENVGTALDSQSIVENLAERSRLRLIGFLWHFDTYEDAADMYDILDTMRGLDENGGNMDTAQLLGTVHITSLTGVQRASLEERYPDITITFDHISATANYYTWNGDTLLHTETILDGGPGTYNGTPSRTADAQYVYTFAGWSTEQNQLNPDPDILDSVERDTNFYAAYTAVVQKYTVTFKNSNGTVLQTVNNVEYGSSATYTGSTPVHPSNPTDMRFDHFEPNGTNITGNTDCVAVYIDTAAKLVKHLSGTMTNYESDTATKIGQYAFYYRTGLTTVRTSATTIEEYAFGGCSALTSVEFTSTSPLTIGANSFMSCNAITSVIIRSTSVSSLSSTNALPSAPFTTGMGVIYVPANLVDSYKSASNWSTYASRIYSIDAYPVEDPIETISDSWSDILAAESDGTYATKYSVGDMKGVTVNGGKYHAQIAAIDSDALSDDSGTAKITWILKEVYNDFNRMNSTPTNANGYPASELRTWLSSTVLLLFPSEIQTAMKEVKKTSWDYTTKADLTSNEKLWIPSVREIFGTGTDYESSGPIYTSVFNNSATRKKMKPGSTSVSPWWLRTAHQTYSRAFCMATSSGTLDSNSAEYGAGVCLGFCT